MGCDCKTCADGLIGGPLACQTCWGGVMKWQPMHTAPFNNILCIDKNGDCMILFKKDSGLWDDGGFNDSIHESDIACWMPLPEPPTKEELEAMNGNA